MILIKSISRDVSTNEVIRWLNRYDTNFLRLNDRTRLNRLTYVNGGFKFSVDQDIEVTTTQIKSYWYRRGDFSYNWVYQRNVLEDFYKTLELHSSGESAALSQMFYHFLKRKVPCIGDSESCLFVNKNIVLQTANSLGFNTPEFIITDNKDDVLKFLDRFDEIITKPIHSPLYYSTKKNWFPTYTNKITKANFKELPKNFKPTLFQEYIDKKIEVRTFYLNGETYSMAIFSQNDEQTKVDFRVYNHDRPNRTTPFRLPANINIKVVKLMKKLDFESGSLDIIYTNNGEYFFLEVNPIGQFGMVSLPCNYNLEKKIAEFLNQK